MSSPHRLPCERVLIVIPTYNEAGNVDDLLAAIRKAVPTADILVVDDSSPDGTGEHVDRFSRADGKVHLLSRPTRDGLAAAYVAGFTWGIEKRFQAIVQMDGDFSHSPHQIRLLIEALGNHDVSVGCRYIRGGGTRNWSLFRRFISRAGNLYARLILNLPYADLTGGFNAWRSEVLETISLSTLRNRGYAFQIELKYLAHQAQFDLVQVPILFEERRAGKSKINEQIVREAVFGVWKLRSRRGPKGTGK